MTARYKDFICEEEAIERRTAALIEVLKEAQCWETGTCTIKETSNKCHDGEVCHLFSSWHDRMMDKHK